MDNKFITRGISKETNEFLYGYPFYGERFSFEEKFSTCWHIVDSDGCAYKIKKEPDQWTGLYDKNKKKIWEGK